MNYFEKNRSFLLTYFSYWENRKEYLELMERFINGKIDGRQFDREFCQMWREDRDKNYSREEFLNKINRLELNKLEGFASLL